jgi:hypothetical protein
MSSPTSGPIRTVTQRVEPSDLADLDAAPPRAALAFATDDGVECVPVAIRWCGDALDVGVDPATLPATGLPERATLLIDDGRSWFELRAIVRRGSVSPAPDPATSSGERWFRFVTGSCVAWDYGALREVTPP